MGKINKAGRWQLYDGFTQNIFENLGLPQLLVALRAIPQNKIKQWFIWELGDTKWRPLTEQFDEFMKVPMDDDTMEIVGLATFVGNRTMTRTVASDTQVTKKIARGKKKAKTKTGIFFDGPLEIERSEKRKNSRQKTKIEVLIDVKGQLHTAHTTDISVIALKLDKTFPIGLDGNFSVILKVQPALELRCSPIIGDFEFRKGEWSRLKINPNFNLPKLIEFLARKT